MLPADITLTIVRCLAAAKAFLTIGRIACANKALKTIEENNSFWISLILYDPLRFPQRFLAITVLTQKQLYLTFTFSENTNYRTAADISAGIDLLQKFYVKAAQEIRHVCFSASPEDQRHCLDLVRMGPRFRAPCQFTSYEQAVYIFGLQNIVIDISVCSERFEDIAEGRQVILEYGRNYFLKTTLTSPLHIIDFHRGLLMFVLADTQNETRIVQRGMGYSLPESDRIVNGRALFCSRYLDVGFEYWSPYYISFNETDDWCQGGFTKYYMSLHIHPNDKPLEPGAPLVLYTPLRLATTSDWRKMERELARSKPEDRKFITRMQERNPDQLWFNAGLSFIRVEESRSTQVYSTVSSFPPGADPEKTDIHSVDFWSCSLPLTLTAAAAPAVKRPTSLI